MIREVKWYQNDSGCMVKALTSLDKDSTIYIGTVRVKITTEAGDQSVERNFDFVFPEEIKTVEEAFEKFDEICKKSLSERNEKIKKNLKKVEQPSEKVE